MDLPPPMRHAVREAKKSSYQHRVGAVVVKRKRILSKGYNQFRTHKWSSMYPYEHVCHAETAALLGLPDSQIKGCAVYVARINLSLFTRLAKPCESCLSLMQTLGVKKVFYTTSKGDYECITFTSQSR